MALTDLLDAGLLQTLSAKMQYSEAQHETQMQAHPGNRFQQFCHISKADLCFKMPYLKE